MSLSLAKSRRLMEGSLDQLQRVNEAKSQFVSDVSHELRTPLTSVRGSLSLLANGAVAPESERGAMLIRIALSNTDRLIRLINERLDLDKIDAGELSLVSAPHRLNEIIRESMQGVGSLAEAKRIVVTVKGPMPFVLVDRDRSIQVLVNLLGNALKFSPPGARVLVTSMCTSEMVRISVRDEGPGMASEQQERLFQRFKQLGNEEWRGSGLGLAISRAIVEEHGGQIGFESSPGNGATFWFTLPLAAVRRLRAPAVA
jgi:signal transduction histidine kinase